MAGVTSRRRAGWIPPAGLTPQQERVFRIAALVIVLLLAAGWTLSIAEAARARRAGEIPLPHPEVGRMSRAISSAILDPRNTSTAFLDELALGLANPMRGASGAVNAAIVAPGSALDVQRRESRLEFRDDRGQLYVSQDVEAPERPGVYSLSLQLGRARRSVENFGLITLVPFGTKQQGRIGSYLLGSWPYERGGSPRSQRYGVPRGFIEVTPENRNFQVSEHFQLGDFLTKGQENVWPKYLLLDPLLLDNLELVIQELERMGVDVQHVEVMSGFRTPQYNESGGNTSGRANLSRHMYGDAADVFVDNDRNGWMDDINGDGKIDTADARMMAEAGERVEKRYPHLIGGIGIYPTCCGHGPFTHFDVRGYRARW